MAEPEQPNPEKKRLNLLLPAKVVEELDKLAVTTDASSITEVIRRSLSLYSLAVEHQNEGGRLVFAHQDGTQETLRLL